MSNTPHIDDLRDRLFGLRVRERELRERQAEIERELGENLPEQERLRQLLVTDAQTSLRLKSTASKESARGTIARIGSAGGFTLGEAATELGWEKPRVKKLLDAMACEVPPTIVSAGHYRRAPMFKYTGPPISEADPMAERQAAATEKVRDWILTQNTTFTPAECAAACDITRTDALRALRALQTLDVVGDEGPTQDMPLFVRTGVDAPDIAVDRPAIAAAPTSEPLSKIPVIQALIDACDRAHAEVYASNGHFSVETLDGRRAIIPGKPGSRNEMLQAKARLRRIGIQV